MNAKEKIKLTLGKQTTESAREEEQDIEEKSLKEVVSWMLQRTRDELTIISYRQATWNDPIAFE